VGGGVGGVHCPYSFLQPTSVPPTFAWQVQDVQTQPVIFEAGVGGGVGIPAGVGGGGIGDGVGTGAGAGVGEGGGAPPLM
jgi:hypothetical protein